MPWEDYWTKLQTGVAGGSTNDVFWINAANLPVYAAQGAIVPIQAIVDDGSIDVDAYPDPCAVSIPSKGRSIGIPRDFDTIALFYNKDLFDKAGVEYPTGDWTWDDLRAAAGEADRQGRRHRYAMGLRLDAWVASRATST